LMNVSTGASGPCALAPSPVPSRQPAFSSMRNPRLVEAIAGDVAEACSLVRALSVGAGRGTARGAGPMGGAAGASASARCPPDTQCALRHGAACVGASATAATPCVPQASFAKAAQGAPWRRWRLHDAHDAGVEAGGIAAGRVAAACVRCVRGHRILRCAHPCSRLAVRPSRVSAQPASTSHADCAAATENGARSAKGGVRELR
jgi:hypothetical protein